MPRINEDEILKCAVYLYSSESDAKAGEASGGSGFLIGIPYTTNSQNYHIYAVTAAHVIDAKFTMVRLNTRDGNTRTITYKQGNWVLHPSGDDVAIALLDLGSGEYAYEYIHGTPDLFITKELQTIINLGPGDEVFMVGRFIGRDEKQSNIPVVRFGHLSSLREEFIEVERGTKQESFLVEIHSISGFSGSPVFVSIPQERLPTEMQDRYNFPTQTYLLGIDWGHLDGDQFSPEKSIIPGMAGVVPAWKLRELLDDDQVIQMRKEREKKLATKSRVRLDVRRSRTQRTLAKNKEDRIDIPVPTKGRFESDLTKAIRKRKD